MALGAGRLPGLCLCQDLCLGEVFGGGLAWQDAGGGGAGAQAKSSPLGAATVRARGHVGAAGLQIPSW